MFTLTQFLSIFLIVIVVVMAFVYLPGIAGSIQKKCLHTFRRRGPKQ